MKKLLLIPLLTIPLFAFAITGDDTRFDWSLGKPAITADNTNTCNDTAQARFDWVLGQPSIVHDSTANCTAAVVVTDNQPRVLIQAGIIIRGEVRIPQ